MRVATVALSLLLVAGLTGLWYSKNDTSAPLRIDCGAPGALFDFCERQAELFSARSGHAVEVLPSPADPELHLAYLLELGRARSTAVDVFLLDISWLGQLAPELRSLGLDTEQLFSLPLSSNTVADKLLAVPLTVDLGVLYVNQPLLEKHDQKLPDSYRDLDQTARWLRLREDEPLWGYALPTQGNAVTDWMVERLAADAAGTIVEQNGAITVLNQLPMRTFRDLQLWADDLIPLEQSEASLDTLWRTGQVLFMRGWATAYLQGAPAFTTVAPLPKGDVRRASVLGGWQLAVNRHSRQVKVAEAFLAHMISSEVQSDLALSSHLPANRAVYSSRRVRAVDPLFTRIPDWMASAVLRPSTVTGAAYPRLNQAVQEAVTALFKGRSPQSTAQILADELSLIKGAGW